MMSKRSKLRELKDALSNWQANKLPQEGFFSTLDELIETSPGERAPAEQWLSYLKPGRELDRDGIKFPLKKEEIEYAKLAELVAQDPKRVLSREEVRQWARDNRPDLLTRPQVEKPSKRLPSYLRMPAKPKQSYGPYGAAQSEMVWGPDSWSAEYGPDKRPGLSHEGIPGGYEESVTISPDLGEFSSHFSPLDISWSRTSRHEIPLKPLEPAQPDADGVTDFSSYSQPRKPGVLRLIEEIQSDRHSRAGEKVFNPQEGPAHEEWKVLTAQLNEKYPDNVHWHSYTMPDHAVFKNPEWADDPLISQLRDNLRKAWTRRGYRSPEDQAELERLPEEIREESMNGRRRNSTVDHLEKRLSELRHTPPDAPFKDPRDYATLEIRKQLLNAVRDNDQFLGLTRGDDQIERYSQGMGERESRGMRETYDKIYPSVLQKEAGRYGAGPLSDVEIQAGATGNVRPQTFVDFGVETFNDLIEEIGAGHPADGLGDLHRLLGDYQGALDTGNPTISRNVRAAQRRLDNLFHMVEGDPEVAFTPEFQQQREEVVDSLSELHLFWEDQAMSVEGRPRTSTKSFPAAELTPEVAERIRKVGVPIFNFAGAGLGGLSALELLQDDEPAFAEGGTVKDSGKRIASGWLSQVLGRDENGELAVPDMAPLPMMLRLLQGKKLITPGVVEELKSLPGLAYDAANWVTDSAQESDLGRHVGMGSDIVDDIQDILFSKPEAIQNAERNVEANYDATRDMLGLREPHGFRENLEESAGVMLGQVPLPGSLLRRLQALKDHSGAAKLASPAVEWLTPTIQPKVSNYAAGTAFGGGTAGLVDLLSEEDADDAAIEEVLSEQAVEDEDDAAIEQYLRSYHE